MANGDRIDVFIVGKGANHRVRPAAAIIRKGQTRICFRNLTVGKARLFFPGGFLDRELLELEGHAEGCATITAEDPGEHAYAVWVAESRDFAIGESSPRIIIDR